MLCVEMAPTSLTNETLSTLSLLEGLACYLFCISTSSCLFQAASVVLCTFLPSGASITDKRNTLNGCVMRLCSRLLHMLTTLLQGELWMSLNPAAVALFSSTVFKKAPFRTMVDVNTNGFAADVFSYICPFIERSMPFL